MMGAPARPDVCLIATRLAIDAVNALARHP
jgi:hypothetical protein